jgi:hypothetical protein
VNLQRTLPLLVFFTFSAFVQAQQSRANSQEFQTLRGSYAAAVERVRKPLRDTYIKELQRLLDVKSKSGKLDEAIEIKGELEKVSLAAKQGNASDSIGVDGAAVQVPPTKGEELNSLRGSYAAAVERVTKPLRDTYMQDLQRLVDLNTKTGKLEGAIEIKRELERVGGIGKPADTAAISGKSGGLASGEEIPFRAGGRNYILHKAKVTLDEALEYCKAQGGTLICLDSARKRGDVTNALAALLPGEKTPNYWLGLTRADADAKFKWVNGSHFDGSVKLQGTDKGYTAAAVVGFSGIWDCVQPNRMFWVICELKK